MPELHKLTPSLGVLQDKGFKVALVTDGRMSGASGKVPAAIHVSPEALNGGQIGLVQNGDMVRVDGENGTLDVLVEADVLAGRTPPKAPLASTTFGRGLFAGMRGLASPAGTGASVFKPFG